MTPRAPALVALALAGCFGPPPPVGGNATDETSGTPSTSIGATTESTGASMTEDPSDTAVMTTGAPTTDDVTSVQPASSGDSGVVEASFCSTIAADVGTLLACEDFDDAGGEVGVWTLEEEKGAFANVLAEDEAPSPPNALHTSFALMSGSGPTAETNTSLGKFTAPMSIRFRMEVLACTGPTPLVNVQYGGLEPMEVRLVHTGVDLSLVIHDSMAGVTPYGLNPAVVGNAGSWAEYILDIDVLSGYVDVRVGGEYAVQVTGVPVPVATPEPPMLHFGVLGGQFDYTCNVWFDDIYAH